MGVVSIATNASRKLIRDAVAEEARGAEVDWDKLFVLVHDAEAKGSKAQVAAIVEKKK